MNEYEFEYEINKDGWFSTHRLWAINKIRAYEDFIEYLKECDIDPNAVNILNCFVSTAEGENE